MKIFILEDLPERQELFRNKFQGHEIKIVENVKDAINLLEKESFDLIYLDHDLEGKCGVDINDSNCGSRVAQYLANKNYQGRVITGSLNPIGAQNIKKILPNTNIRPGYWQEPNMIEDFHQKKLVEYLEDGQKVLCRFGHGLGDTILWMPAFEKLKRLYPKVHFDLYVESGQEEIYQSIKDKDAPGYDLVFSLNFPMSEGSEMTKVQKCCKEEIGIEPPELELAQLPKHESPFVACHFQGTALPGSVNCSEEVARQIWQEIKDFGKIPIECHFEHCWHNPVNKRYGFVDVSVRGYHAKVSNLIGLVQHSFAFIGVASGPFIVALSVMPERIFYLEKNHPLKTYAKRTDIKKIKISAYQGGMVKDWLSKL